MHEVIDVWMTTMRQDNEHEFYTVPEAARLLNVSQATIWRWVTSQKLLAYRVGPRRIRIKREDLQRVVRPVRPKDVARTDRDGQGHQDIWATYDSGRTRHTLHKKPPAPN